MPLPCVNWRWAPNRPPCSTPGFKSGVIIGWMKETFAAASFPVVNRAPCPLCSSALAELKLPAQCDLFHVINLF